MLDNIRQGDRRSLARAMTLADTAGADARALQDALRCATGQVPWWGFTGPPGVGKSTLIDCLIDGLRRRGRRVGVVAVDPTSPLSDGALLGDRVRMMRHAVDRDVFIRSLATRHREGGISDATVHCGRLLELAGFDPVLVETVGVGQNEVDIASVAGVCVVLLGPGYGDDIQLIKAGLLETADLIVVNKCDLPEATRLLRELRGELEQGKSQNVKTSKRQSGDASDDAGSVEPAAQIGRGHVEIVATEAKSGKGVDELLDRLIVLDEAARDPAHLKQRRRRHTLDEVKRSALSAYERALEHALTSPRAEDLLAHLESGTAGLDQTIGELSTIVTQLDGPRESTGPQS